MAKCSFHGDKEAVEKCTICGKDMCADCAPKYVDERVACPVCAKESIKKERKGYMWSIPAVALGILMGIGVIVLLSILIARDGQENLFRNIGVLVGVVIVLAGACFLLVKCIGSYKYYNKRYQIAIAFEKAGATTTAPAADKKEEKATTTAKKSSKAKKAEVTTTTEAKTENLSAVSEPKTAKGKTNTAAKTAPKAKEATTTAKPVAKKSTSKATTTAKKEVKPVEKKAITTAKKSSTPAKKAAAKKSTTKK